MNWCAIDDHIDSFRQGRLTTAFDYRRVVGVVADHCMIEDRVDRSSS